MRVHVSDFEYRFCARLAGFAECECGECDVMDGAPCLHPLCHTLQSVVIAVAGCGFLV